MENTYLLNFNSRHNSKIISLLNENYPYENDLYVLEFIVFIDYFGCQLQLESVIYKSDSVEFTYSLLNIND